MPFPTDTAKLPELMQQAIEWLVLLRSGEISEAETQAFADWLSQDIYHAQAFAKAEDLLNDAAIAAQNPRVTAPAIADTRETNPNKQTIPLTKPAQATRQQSSAGYFRWLAVPLSLAAAWLFAVALILPEQSHVFDDYLSDYRTGTGELRDIQLADGSHLLLNTNTAVSVDYTESLRHITLRHGQAQFTVAKDTNRPFEVASGGLAICALGTVFEVYNPGSGEMSITVQEHAVAAKLQKAENIQVEIKEGQRLRYDYKGHLTIPETVNLAQASAWKQLKLFMNDWPLAELIAELDRYRTGRIFISDPSLKNLRITGAFSLDNPDETLAKVRTVLALQETRLGSWWVLLHR
ncbi:FecR family protein [Methyloglobulus sp.]|uniref:FecR family protein n=1 Tax=Methyloglobulus sp. TaxID=2518622 RepID=UPI0039899A64